MPWFHCTIGSVYEHHSCRWHGALTITKVFPDTIK